MRLSKALKEKNKKVKKLSTLFSRMLTSNVHEVGKPPVYKSKELMDEAINNARAFSMFKANLFNSTAPIRYKIFLMSELKSAVNQLKSLSFSNNIRGYGYGAENPVISTIAQIEEKERDNKVEALEKEIEDLQDDIDGFNATNDLLTESY